MAYHHLNINAMKEKLKRFAFKYPILEKQLRIIQSGQSLGATRGKKNIKGRANQIEIDKTAILFNCTIDITGNNNKIEIGEGSILNNVTFFIRGDNNTIKLGKKVKFIRGGSIWIEDYSCEAFVGDDTTFEDTHIAVTEPNSKIHIGKDCMFAYGIDVRTGDSHSIIDSISKKRINYAQDVFIGNHVWIASHVSILKGVHIPDNSVVATRAVVTKSFQEKNILIGGMPAKKLKENIDWDRDRIYEDS